MLTECKTLGAFHALIYVGNEAVYIIDSLAGAAFEMVMLVAVMVIAGYTAYLTDIVQLAIHGHLV